jgi:hypothetical protein
MKLFLRRTASFAIISAAAICLTPKIDYACACGCGVFDVGSSAMMPMGAGGMYYLEYDYGDQNRNWSGTSKRPAENNGDKEIKTSFYKLGAQYMFNRKWGVEGEVPYSSRRFKTTDPDTSDIVSFDHSAFGDIRLKGIYSGFSQDMSFGITFGIKLPNGDYKYGHFDRDTEIGTGSTDSILGGYHMGNMSATNSWFAQGQWERAFMISDNYRPGDEFDGAIGITHTLKPRGRFTTIAPLLQLIGSYRLKDAGANANPDNTGYSRILLSPGIETDAGDYRFYADVEVPVYQNVIGNQVTSPVQFKIIVGRSF